MNGQREGNGGFRRTNDRPEEYWNKNHFPLGWSEMTPAVQKVAFETANKAFFEGASEEDATKKGKEAAEKYALEHQIPVLRTNRIFWLS